MTKEEKSLLLQDLCARLPYGFKYQVQYGDTSVRNVEKFILDDECSLFDTWMVHEIKPYLRPMSSMTDEEKTKYQQLKNQLVCQVNTINGGNLWKQSYIVDLDKDSIDIVDWLNSHHFDYRGLIEKGLALEAQEEMFIFK